jgi:hypothetical protein
LNCEEKKVLRFSILQAPRHEVRGDPSIHACASWGGIRRNSQLLHSVKAKKRERKKLYGVFYSNTLIQVKHKKRKRKKKKREERSGQVSPPSKREVEKIKKKCAEIPQLDP